MEEAVPELEPGSKKLKTEKMDPEPVMSGALPVEDTRKPSEKKSIIAEGSATPAPSIEPNPTSQNIVTDFTNSTSEASSLKPHPNPPAARLTMTVTSGFYVRSLCHDLGLALSSYGTMATLVRSRQGDYTLNKNVFEFDELAKGEEVWGPQIQGMLENSMKNEGWEAAKVVVQEHDEGGRTPVSGDERGGGGQRNFDKRNKNRRGKGGQRGGYKGGHGDGRGKEYEKPRARNSSSVD